MIDTIQDDILTQLTNVSGVKTVGAWQGDLEDLLAVPLKLPALQVVYRGASFEEKQVMGSNRADHRMEFLIWLLSRNLKSRAEGGETCYTIIEAVRAKLVGRRITGYGMLWPVNEDLVFAEGGTLVYGMTYRIDTNVTP